MFKVFVGFVFIWIYTFYYEDKKTGDIHKFFDSASKIKLLCGNDFAAYLKILLGIYDENESKINTILSKIDFWTLGDETNLVNDSRLVVRYNMLMLLFSNGNKYVHVIPITFFTLMGQVGIYTYLKTTLKRNRVIILTGVFFIPSFIFWSSGILKEAFLIGFMGIALMAFGQIVFSKKYYEGVIMLIIGLLGIFYSKFYVLFPVLILLLIETLLVLIRKKQRIIASIISIFLMLCGIFFIPNLLDEAAKKVIKKQKRFMDVAIGGIFITNEKDTFRIPYKYAENCIISEFEPVLKISKKTEAFNYVNLKDEKKVFLDKDSTQSFRVLEILTGANSYFNIPIFKGTVWAKTKATFIYITNAIFRPTLLEVKNLFQVLSGIENLIFTALLLLRLIFSKFEFERNEVSVIVYILFLAFLIGSTTPVAGAIVRYKIPFLPFLFVLLINNKTFEKIREIASKAIIKITQ